MRHRGSNNQDPLDKPHHRGVGIFRRVWPDPERQGHNASFSHELPRGRMHGKFRKQFFIHVKFTFRLTEAHDRNLNGTDVTLSRGD